MVHTVSVSREGKVRIERVDAAHDTGFGLVNPLSEKKQITGKRYRDLPYSKHDLTWS